VHPEHRRADHQVAHRPAADPGDHREEAHRYQRLAHARGHQRTREREQGNAAQIDHPDHRGQHDLGQGGGIAAGRAWGSAAWIEEGSGMDAILPRGRGHVEHHGAAGTQNRG
jgi:hypothetical protein